MVLEKNQKPISTCSVDVKDGNDSVVNVIGN